MANFVEEATLRVNDQASAQIKAINAALKTLTKTAASLKSATANININTKGLSQATTQLHNLASTLKSMKSSPPILIRADAHGLAQARQQIAALRAAARPPINVGVGGGGMGGGGYHRRGGAGAIAQGLSSGFGAGIPIPLGGPPALIALEVAAYAAAAALKAVAESGLRRDRTQLQSNVMLTNAQRQRFKEIDAANEKARAQVGTAGAPPMPFTKDVRDRLRTSLIGDVGGKTEGERADAAEVLTKYLETEVYPRVFATDPTKSPEEAAAGLRKLVQATNLATSSMTEIDKTTGQQVVSKDAMRIFRGVEMSQIVDPELKADLVKSVLANAKTAGFALSSQAIATMLLTASNQGVRAGNETFRAIKALSGTVDVKMLNNALAGLGLLENVSRKDPTKAQKKRGELGNVITGSGTPVDAKLLQEDPARYVDTHIRPKMEKELEEMARKRAEKAKAAKGKGKGVTDEEWEDVKSGVVSQADRIAWLTRAFPGMNAAAINGISQMMLNYQQFGVSLEQASKAIEEGKADPGGALRKSMSVGLENIRTQLENQRAKIGDEAFKAIGGADTLNKVARAIAEPTGKDAQDVAKNYAKAMATLTMTPFDVAAALLKSAGSALLDAAGVQTSVFSKWAEALGIKQKTPEEKAKEARDAETKRAVDEAEKAKKHNQDALARAERQRDAAQKAVHDSKTAEERTKNQFNANKFAEEAARLRAAIEANTEAAQTIRDRAAAAEVPPAEIPTKNLAWVDAAFEALRKRMAAEVKKPPKPVPTDWEGGDTPATRKANMEAARAERKRQIEEARRRPKAERDEDAKKWGDPKKFTPLEGIEEAMKNGAAAFSPAIEGLNSAATAVGESGNTAASFLQNAAGGIGATIGDAAAAKIAAAANQIRDITVNVSNSGAAKPDQAPLKSN